jgi:hypothetical protein
MKYGHFATKSYEIIFMLAFLETLEVNSSIDEVRPV